MGDSATLWESRVPRRVDIGGYTPEDINDAGVVVGGPYRWEDGVSQEAYGVLTHLCGINDEGWIVGGRTSLYGDPVLIDSDGQRVGLTTFPEGHRRGSHTSGVITNPVLSWSGSILVGGSGEGGQVGGVWFNSAVNVIGHVTAANDDAYLLQGAALFLDGERYGVPDLLTNDAVEILSLNAIGNEGHIVGRGRLRASGETGAILLTPRF